MTYLRDLMARIQDMQVQALADQGITVGAVLQPDYLNTPPYFASRLTAMNQGFNSDEISDRVVTVEMLLVMDHMTAGWKADNAIILAMYDYITYIEDFFAQYNQLTSDNFPAPLQYLHPIGATLTSDGGVSSFQYAGVPHQQLGARFTLSVPFIRENYGG